MVGSEAGMGGVRKLPTVARKWCWEWAPVVVFVGWRWWLTFLLQIGDLINFCNFWSILSWQYGQVWQNWVYKAKELARIWKVKLDQNFLTIPNLGSDACQLVYYFGLNSRYHTIVRTQKHHIRVLSLALHPIMKDRRDTNLTNPSFWTLMYN